jgi:hypothetical protein
MIPLAAADGETAAFLVIGVLGVLMSISVFAVPQLYDRISRARIRMLDETPDEQRTLDRDRARRRFIAMILGVFSLVILVQGLTRL